MEIFSKKKSWHYFDTTGVNPILVLLKLNSLRIDGLKPEEIKVTENSIFYLSEKKL